MWIFCRLCRCMNELARNIIKPFNDEGENSIRIGNSQESGRFFNGNSSPNRQTMTNNQFFNELVILFWIFNSWSWFSRKYFLLQLTLLSRRFKLPFIPNLLGVIGIFRPGQSFYNAMSSIAHYDDYKCVSRILCEVATGTMPGNYLGRQISEFQQFGQNPLYR